VTEEHTAASGGAKQAYGCTTEDLSSNLPSAQVHAALTYYYEDQAEFDADIQRSEVESRELEQRLSDSELRKKLNDLARRRES
jgi:hypothetical protein